MKADFDLTEVSSIFWIDLSLLRVSRLGSVTLARSG